MKIWAHTIVHNEDKFIWFSMMSVVDYVDKVMIWDTGSDDKTVDIVKEIIKIKRGKIDFKEVGQVDKFEFTKMRQKMLDQTKADWIIVVDGDEIWWKSSIHKLTDRIKKDGGDIKAITVPFYNLIGDTFHYQAESAGRYKLLGKVGHLSIRAINCKIPGLHVDLPYGKEGYFDIKNEPIQESRKVIFLNHPYLHTSHLIRSSKPQKYNKIKYELGLRFSSDFRFPEVFYKKYPSIVDSPWQKMSFKVLVKSILLTLPKLVRRRLIIS